LLPKESSWIDETIENRVIRRMAVLGALSGSMSMKMAMRQTTRFSVVSSIQDDSLGSKHLPGDI